MTPANKRKAKERKAKRDAGLVPVEVWVPKGREADIKAKAKELVDAPRIVRNGLGDYTVFNAKVGDVVFYTNEAALPKETDDA